MYSLIETNQINNQYSAVIALQLNQFWSSICELQVNFQPICISHAQLYLICFSS